MIRFLFCGFICIFSANINAQSPAIQFNFNTNFKDTGTYKLLGIPFGNPSFTSDKFGNPNRACNFDGVDDYIDLDTAKILKPTSNLTLAIWAYSDNWSGFTNSPTLIGNTEDGGYGLMINNTNNEFEAKVYRKGAFGAAGYALSKITSGWHQFGLTYSAGITTLYIDGKFADSNNVNFNSLIGYSLINNRTIIGDESASGPVPEGKKFKGKIDDIRYYFFAMTEPQIQALYSTSAAIFSDVVVEKENFIYPNPVLQKINLQSIENPKGAISIDFYDLTGSLKHTIEVFDIQNEIQFERPKQLTNGMYLVNIKEADHMIAHQYISFE